MTIVARFYPNGEFTHGVDTSHRRDRKHPPQTSTPNELIPVGASVSLHGGDICGEYFPNAEIVKPGDTFMSAKNADIYTYLCNDMGSHVYAIEYASGQVCVSTLWDSVFNLVRDGALVPLGSSSAGVLKKTPKTRAKSKGMTKRMARRIRNTAHLLQEKYKHYNLSFLTLTLPDLSPQDLAKCAANWGKMTHKFLVWLRYRVELKNIPFEYVYCTEIQTKRLERTGNYALHLHLVFRGRYGKASPWAITPLQARKSWIRCLVSVLGHGNFKRCAIENLRTVRKSAGGYLSKYMSKGNCHIPENVKGDFENAPSINWGGYSRNLSRELDSATINIRSDGSRAPFARAFVSRIREAVADGVVAFYHESFIEFFATGDSRDTRYIKVGVGRIADKFFRLGLGFLEQYFITKYEQCLTEFA